MSIYMYMPSNLHASQAFCEPGKVKENGVLAFAQHVLFPILAGEGIVQRIVSLSLM